LEGGTCVLNNIVARSGLTTEQQLIVNSELEKKRKNKGIAYLLWFFLGGFGGHRFYVGDTGIAIGMILVWIIGWFTFFIPSIIWVIIDAFLLSKRVDTYNETAELEIIQKVKMLAANSELAQ
jgi:TM2 domain-containing membrane protein YozV